MNKDTIKRKIRRSRQMIYLGVKSLKKDGVWMTGVKVFRVLGFGRTLAYRRWARNPIYTDAELEQQRHDCFDRNIKFSIVTPLYNTKPEFLHNLIDSIQAQTYGNWELCLADGSDDKHGNVETICREYMGKDDRIKYRKLEENYGIVGNSNAAIELATGDFISLIDHDDILHPAALHDVMEKICNEGADFIYTDELIFLESNLQKVTLIHFKKDFAPDDLRGNNYICHFTSFSRQLIEKCGAFRDGFDGSQDHDLFLRLTAEAEKIVHIAKPLYYWRSHGESVAQSADNKPYAGESGKKAVMESLKAAGIKATIDYAKGLPTVYRVSYELPDVKPRVNIIIPNCDHLEDLSKCMESILEKTAYGNYEITVIENNSKDPALFEYYDQISREHENISVLRWEGTGFNWAALNNFAVRENKRGEYLLFMNNDMEVINDEWIEEMLMHAGRPEVGAVGAMLYFPDDTIQHAGVILNLGGIAGHACYGLRREDPGYMGRLSFAQNMSAVTGACLMVSREIFGEVGGFDEELAVILNDVDFCLKLREAGYLNIWTPYAELYHYESKSRGVYATQEDRLQSDREKELFCQRWKDVLEAGDPYYNPNLSLLRSNFEPR